MGAAASALRGTPLSAPLGTGIRPRPPRCTGSARGVPVVQPPVPRDTVAREIDAQPTWTPPRPHDAVWCAGSVLEQRGHGSAPTPPGVYQRRSIVDGLGFARNVRAAQHATEQQNDLARDAGRSLATPTPPPPHISLAPDPPDVRRTARRRKFVSASTHAHVCRSGTRVRTRAQVLKAESARSADETGDYWLNMMTVRFSSCSSR